MNQILPQDILRDNPHLPIPIKKLISTAKKIHILQGKLNRVFLIDETFVLRTKKVHVNAYDDIGGCVNFKKTIQYIEKNGFSYHPKILFAFEVAEPHHQFREYLLYQNSKGNPLSAVFNSLNDSQTIHLAAQAAKRIAKLHAISTSHVGFFHGDRFNSWAEYIEHWLQNQSPYIIDNALLTLKEVEKIRRIFTHHRRYFEITPSVIHLDFRPSNLIVDKNRNIVSIIDWDNARGGDPIADIAYTVTRAFKENSYALFSRQFVKTYLAVTNIKKEDFEKKMKLYHLFYAFKLLPVHATHVSDKNETPQCLIEEIRTLLKE